jgi:aldehyde dehydrogenase (NAD+)
MREEGTGMSDAPTTVRGEVRMLIDGKLVEAASGKTYENINPATEEPLGVVADAGEEDTHRAIDAARRAFDETTWATDHKFRRLCLEQLHAALVEAKEEIRRVAISEVGCPVMITPIQVDFPIDDFEFALNLADTYEYESWLPEAERMGTRHRRLVRREPVGVVGAITPWNFPLFLNLAKLGPALAAGNTVVLKPAPDTPWSATIIGRLIAEKTDIPPGVVNIVTSSDPAKIGEVLTTDLRVDMITFTGSTATGKRIMVNGAGSVKKVFLELGGKSANIILDDADFSAAVPVAAATVCVHAGQGCAITTRLLLPRSRYDEGVEIAKAAFQNLRYGDPTEPGILQGPQISERQRQRVVGYIEKGKAEGARLVLGGGVPQRKGFFVEPTLFVDVDPKATIAQEEIFGPVLAVTPFEDDDDAVRIANDSVYGLSGSITSASEERAIAVANRLRTGTVSVNGGLWNTPDAPFGGYKQSGVGREWGIQGFEEYLETKIVALPATG